MELVNVLEKKTQKDNEVNKVSFIKTEQLTHDTYYFKSGQILSYHRHPDGDQIFFVHEGEGTFYCETGGKEESIAIKAGSVVLAPKGVWHKIVAKSSLVVSQATRQPAGMEKR